MTGVQFPARVGIFSLCHCIQTGSQAHLASYPVGNGDPFSGCYADSSLPSGAEVKNAQICTSTPQYILMVWYFIKYRDNFTFLITFSYLFALTFSSCILNFSCCCVLLIIRAQMVMRWTSVRQKYALFFPTSLFVSVKINSYERKRCYVQILMFISTVCPQDLYKRYEKTCTLHRELKITVSSSSTSSHFHNVTFKFPIQDFHLILHVFFAFSSTVLFTKCLSFN
jgi:cytochrome c oxidase subunit IV